MLLVFAFTIAAASAENAKLGDYTFTIPDDWEIVEQTDDGVKLESIDVQTITVSLSKEKLNPDELFKRLEAQGFEVNDHIEDNYQEGPFNVSKYALEYDVYTGYAYVCENNDDLILICHVTPSEDDLEGSFDDVVNDILSSLKKN